MSTQTANSLIVLSAFTVAAVYFWRWQTKGAATSAPLSGPALLGARHQLVTPEGFTVAWGVIYLVLTGLAVGAPALAGALALLIMLGDLLANGIAVSEGAAGLEAKKGAAALHTATAQRGGKRR